MSEETQRQLDTFTGGTLVALDHDKLGRAGFILMGRVEAMKDCVTMFSAHRNRSAIMSERAVLSQVVEGLQEGLEDAQKALVEFAIKRGAAKAYEVPAVQAAGEVSNVAGTASPTAESDDGRAGS